MTHTQPSFAPVELPSRYAKAIVAVLTAALSFLVTAITDNVVTLDERFGLALAIVTAVGVYLVPNFSAGVARYAKMLVAFAGTALQTLVPLIDGGSGITASTWLLVLVAALGAISVGIIPNATTQRV